VNGSFQEWLNTYGFFAGEVVMVVVIVVIFIIIIVAVERAA
jgi:hypothetical protein